MALIGVDLGGTKIEAAVLDSTGEIIFRERLPTPKNQYRETLNTIATLVQQVRQAVPAVQQANVGIAAPGALSPKTGLLKNSNSVCLIGKPLQQDLEQQLRCAVRIANDADCLTLSEAVDGAAARYNLVFGIILGTGVGGGLVVGKQLLSGPNAITGEWGHNPLPWPLDHERPGPLCYCGKSGCIETFLSGPGLERDYSAASHLNCHAEEIVQLAHSGDPLASQTLERYWDRLARAIAHVINIVDPDCVVVGGGVSNISELYQQLPVRLPGYVFSDTVETVIVPARFGDSSGVRGAAWLWAEK